jgi:hypothetical protein
MTTKEQTYWNGEECEAEKVKVIVADTGRFPKYWARPFVGQWRRAVRVTYNDVIFYLDNEDGKAWWKVTTGRGRQEIGHRHLEVERER